MGYPVTMWLWSERACEFAIPLLDRAGAEWRMETRVRHAGEAHPRKAYYRIVRDDIVLGPPRGPLHRRYVEEIEDDNSGDSSST